MTNSFPKLNIPEAKLQVNSSGQKVLVKCLVRRKDVSLTPEEWVRQHFIWYLNVHLGYPLSLMRVERGVKVNNVTRRFDLTCSDNSGRTVVLVECKSYDVELKPQTFDQAAAYNLELKVPFLIITNGIKHIGARVDLEHKSFEYLKNIPDYSEVRG